MKNLLRAVFFLFVFVTLGIRTADAATAWYQPTPYPLNKKDGSNMPNNNIAITHEWDGWVNNLFGAYFTGDSIYAGGQSGSYYWSYIEFDTIGLPKDVTQAVLWLKTLPQLPNSSPTGINMCQVGSPWSPATITWATQPSLLSPCWSYGTIPTPGQWWGPVITDWYNSWQNYVVMNNGILIYPQTATNNFTGFAGTRYATDGDRPILQLDFTPTFEFKMPLPGGYSWLVTTEAGGYDCTGDTSFGFWPDAAHQDGNYFSVDISWDNVPSSGIGTSPYGKLNTPVLAVASGLVYFAGMAPQYNPDGTPNKTYANGYYIVIDHDTPGTTDSDKNPGTGFSTRYLHLAGPPIKANGQLLQYGDRVSAGDQVGIMGTTGQTYNVNTGTWVPSSTGVHLHFGIRYTDSGSWAIPQLAKVLMENKLLKSYQTECTTDSTGKPITWSRRYPSTMTSTGS